MKLAIVPDTAVGSPGIDRYARELITRLIESGAVEQVVLAYSKDWTKRALPWLEANQSEKVRSFILPLPNCPLGKELRQLFIAPYMLNRLCNGKIDIVHDLYHFAPFMLGGAGYKRVVTVHDLTPFMTRWLHPSSQRISFYVRYKYVLPLILKRADALITISHNTKRDLEKYLGINPDKIKVIYHGISEDYKPIIEPERLGKLRHDYGLNFPFILGQASFGPVDNITLLIEAFRLFQSNISYKAPQLESLKLVLFGNYNPKILSVIRAKGLERDVILLGYVPESDLAALYSTAELFVFPSLYEGFGFPPLEAMACGTPTMVSNVASLPEVVGDGAFKFDPLDAFGLAREMHNLLNSDDVRRNMRVIGHNRAREFSWGRTSSETLKVYSELLDGK